MKLQEAMETIKIRELRFNRSHSIELSTEEVENISKYLENPTKSGIWTLNANWMNYRGISEFVIKNLNDVFKDKDTIEIHSGKIKFNLNKEEMDNLIQKTKTLKFIFDLFTYLLLLEREDESLIEYIEMINSEDKLIFELIDLEKTKTEYSEAFEYFKEFIYFERFMPVVDANKILKIKNGLFIILAEDSWIKSLSEGRKKNINSKNITLLSLNPEPLEQLKIFYEKLNKIEDASLLPSYSPEEDIFAPYFFFLEHAYKHFIPHENIKNLFESSIEEYRDCRKSAKIGTL